MPKTLTICFLFLLCSFSLQAQEDLRQHEAFFQRQLPKFQTWMEDNQLSQYFSIQGVAIQEDSLILILSNAFQSDDSLKKAWEELENTYIRAYRLRIGEEMFDHFSFLFQVKPEQAVIKVLGSDGQTECIAIYYDEYLQIKSLFSAQMDAGNLSISLNEISQLTAFKKKTIEGSEQQTVKEINAQVKELLASYYEGKGAKLELVYADEERDYYNSFVLRASCLREELINNNGNEYLQVKVKVQQIGDDIQVSYAADGAFAAGPPCPLDREQAYTSISNTDFPEAMSNYLSHLEQIVDNNLTPRSSFPRFSLRPPTPSTKTSLDPQYFKHCRTLKDYDFVLQAALKTCGYTDRSYYAVPNGFALVSRLEYFNETSGVPKVPGRWTGAQSPAEDFSIWRLLKLLFSANPGYYRIIVFVVTDQPVQPQGDGLSSEEGDDLLDQGSDLLYRSANQIQVSPDHAVTVLIYEFENPESGEGPHFLKYPNNKLGHAKHLTGAGLLKALNN